MIHSSLVREESRRYTTGLIGRSDPSGSGKGAIIFPCNTHNLILKLVILFQSISYNYTILCSKQSKNLLIWAGSPKCEYMHKFGEWISEELAYLNLNLL